MKTNSSNLFDDSTNNFDQKLVLIRFSTSLTVGIMCTTQNHICSLLLLKQHFFTSVSAPETNLPKGPFRLVCLTGSVDNCRHVCTILLRRLDSLTSIVELFKQFVSFSSTDKLRPDRTSSQFCTVKTS